MVHAINFCGVKKALQVFAQAENSRTLFGRVTSDAFKDAGAVMQNVRHNVNACIVPFDKLAVMPDNVADAGCFNVLVLAVF
jgi:hypothetical protein